MGLLYFDGVDTPTFCMHTAVHTAAPLQGACSFSVHLYESSTLLALLSQHVGEGYVTLTYRKFQNVPNSLPSHTTCQICNINSICVGYRDPFRQHTQLKMKRRRTLPNQVKPPQDSLSTALDSNLLLKHASSNHKGHLMTRNALRGSKCRR